MTLDELDKLFKKTQRVGFNQHLPCVYLYLQSEDEANKLYNELDLFFGSDNAKLIIHLSKGLFLSIMSLIDDKKIVTTNALECKGDDEIKRFDAFMKENPESSKILLGKGYIFEPTDVNKIIDIKNPNFVLRLNGYKVI